MSLHNSMHPELVVPGIDPDTYSFLLEEQLGLILLLPQH